MHAVLYLMHIPNAISKDTFVNNKAIVADNNMNVENAIFIDRQTYQNALDSVKQVGTIKRGIIDSNQIELYVDPYIDYYIFDNKQNHSYKDGIFICLSYKKIEKEECIWDLEGKVVAYIYVSDYLFIQALIKGYRLDKDKIHLRKLNLEDLDAPDKLFDYLITYAVINSKYMQYIDEQLYFKNGFKDVDIDRLKAFYPFIKENYNSMKFYFSDVTRKSYVNSENNVLIPIMNYSIVTYITEGFITRLDYLNDTDLGDEYGCYGNGSLTNKHACNSFYNIDGTEKTYYSLWDKRCKVNSDCPYYQANKNYPNDRGGCKDGYCEFPVGVKRLGFTKYDDQKLNNPLCYECSNMNDLECCKTIEKNTGRSPDYVFSGDFQDRVNNKMNTIISLLDYRI